MFRKASENDIDRIAEIYSAVHSEEEAGRAVIGWDRAVYPVRKTAETGVQSGDLFVCENDEGRILAAARINREQVPEYAAAAWRYDAADEEVMVMHTLVVDPAVKGTGIGSEFAAFYEAYAKKHGCPELRIDTNEKNAAARRLYKRLGYEEVSIVNCVFNGIPGVRLVCLEKRLEL